MKTKRKAAASSYKSNRNAQTKSYGVGGAVMTLGKNLIQGKKLGSGALKGVLRAGITPGSGVGAGLGMAGALAGKSDKPWLQKVGKGLGMAGSVAGMFTGGGAGGAEALGGLAGKFAGSGVGQAASKFAGNFAGIDKTLGGIGAASGGNPLMALAQNFIPGTSGANGMRVRKFEDGGVVEKEPPSVNSLLEALGTDDERGLNQLLNQQYREDVRNMETYGDPEADASHFEKDAARDNKIFKKNTLSIKSGVEGNPELGFRGEGIGIERDVNKLLRNLENPKGTRDRQEILQQIARMAALGTAGSLVGASGGPGGGTSPWARLFPGIFDNQ
tara:strand:+ start:18 stop:1007 length:990 start_codon:yes stop_codon:yes gene_type:complete